MSDKFLYEITSTLYKYIRKNNPLMFFLDFSKKLVNNLLKNNLNVDCFFEKENYIIK